MLVRNVGHLMTTPAVLDRDRNPVPEGLLDAMVTVLSRSRPARPGFELPHRLDLRRQTEDARARRSRVHDRDLQRVSKTCSGYRPNTVKIGIMDEERRTTLNLGECIRAARVAASRSSTPGSSTAPATRSTPR